MQRDHASYDIDFGPQAPEEVVSNKNLRHACSSFIERMCIHSTSES